MGQRAERMAVAGMKAGQARSQSHLGAPEPELGRPLAVSAGLHIVLISLLLFSAFYAPPRNAWSAPGGGGDAVSINAVGSLPGVPLPRPMVVSTSRVVDVTQGLYKSEPLPKKPPPPPPDATPLQKFEKEKKLPPSRPSRLLENDYTPPQNAVPYGEGGTPAMPYTQFTTGSGSQGGIGMAGPTGAAGNFATRYAWYVEAVQRRISGNWLQSTIDPSIRFAPRVVMEFQIFRDGSVRNIQITQSSGNVSVDRSALRAVQDSIPFQALPGDYSGSYVSVQFWFEFHR